MNLNGEIECQCGCRRWFKPVRRNQRFFEPACRKKFHAEEMVDVRRKDLEKAIDFMENTAGTYWIEVCNRLKAALEKK